MWPRKDRAWGGALRAASTALDTDLPIGSSSESRPELGTGTQR